MEQSVSCYKVQGNQLNTNFRPVCLHEIKMPYLPQNKNIFSPCLEFR